MKGLMERQHETSTEVLAVRAQNGGRAAFDELVSRFHGGLEAWVHSKMGDRLQSHVEVDDVVQETFTWAFRSIQRLHWKGERAFDRWLCAIAHHVILKAAASQRRASHLALDRDVSDKGTPPSKMARRSERFARLEGALEGLSPDHRKVILLSMIDGLSIKEIAARMNRSPDAVMKLLRRALKKHKEGFGDTESFGLPDRSLRTQGDDDAAG